MIKVIYQ